MLIYLILTLLFLIGGACMLWWFFAMIQRGGALDIVFGWQDMLERLYNGTKAQQLLGNALGDCKKCTSFWFMPVWFCCYYLICKFVFHGWITDLIVIDNICAYSAVVCIVNIVWYAIFHSIGGMIGLLYLNKLFDK